MASDVATNQASKSSAKRKNKKSTADAKVDIPPAPEAAVQTPAIEEEDHKADGEGFENPYIRDLQKQIRNVNKKLSGMAKVDSIVAESPNVSLDDLVAQRKINQDQKAQVLKKPALQQQLKDYEEQITMHKKIDEDFRKRLQAQKDRLQADHQKELDEAKAAVEPAPAPEPQEAPKPDLREPLLTLSKFLRAAAARRQDSDETSEDSKGFEGVLLLLYGGDNAAVDAAERLITGSSDLVPSTEGGHTSVSYDRVKQLATEYAPFASEEAWVNGVADASTAEPSAEQPSSDPTIANAGLTEIDTTPVPTASADPTEVSAISGPAQSTTDAAAANTAASASTPEPLADSWVSVPRAPEETETHNAGAATAVPSNQTENTAEQGTTTLSTESLADTKPTESWGDSPMDNPPVPQSQQNGDGFREVVRGRGRGPRANGNFDNRGRGRGGGGGFRGDRGRGDFRGRGRGSFDGGRGGRGGRGRGGREVGAPAM